MPRHSEGPGIWLSVWRFLLTHCMYERAAEVLARLRGCAGSPEPSLLAYAISTRFAWRGPNNLLWSVKTKKNSGLSRTAWGNPAISNEIYQENKVETKQKVPPDPPILVPDHCLFIWIKIIRTGFASSPSLPNVKKKYFRHKNHHLAKKKSPHKKNRRRTITISKLQCTEYLSNNYFNPLIYIPVLPITLNSRRHDWCQSNVKLINQDVVYLWHRLMATWHDQLIFISV